jgi:hypothetical protein
LDWKRELIFAVVVNVKSLKLSKDGKVPKNNSDKKRGKTVRPANNRIF